MKIIETKNKTAPFCTSTGRFIHIGDELTCAIDGKKAICTGWRDPRTASSTGRICVRTEDEEEWEYFPSVYDCILIKLGNSEKE